MGLSRLEMVDTSVLHFRGADDELLYADGPEGEPDLQRPMCAVVYGPGTKQFARAQTAEQNRRLAKASRKGKVELSTDESIEDRVDFASAVTKELRNFDNEKGLDASDFVRSVYSNLKLSFLRDQVEQHARNTANFKPSSTTNSASGSDTAHG
jgi:hypothetical protein